MYIQTSINANPSNMNLIDLVFIVINPSLVDNLKVNNFTLNIAARGYESEKQASDLRHRSKRLTRSKQFAVQDDYE